MADLASEQSTNAKQTDNRRSFLAIITGALAMLTPLAAGVATFCTPLFRKRKDQQVRVALLSQVPDDGQPRYFPVSIDREDAWNRYPSQRVGAVYLVRPPDEATPTAFSAKCPHAGCFIGYTAGDDRFQCPCHTSAFNLDGSRARGDQEVSPRDMDTLTVEVRELKLEDADPVSEVWVKFIDYQTGHSEKHPTT